MSITAQLKLEKQNHLPRRREEREGKQKILPGLKQKIKDFLRDLRVFAVQRF
jgi:hypothetical protein